MSFAPKARFKESASRRRFEHPATQTLFSRTLPEGEDWIKHRNRNTTAEIYGMNIWPRQSQVPTKS
jgi:hypothetical protein